jgi:hypothetical protein
MQINGIALSSTQHRLLKEELRDRAATMIARILADYDHGGNRIERDADARKVAARIADEFLGLVTQTERLATGPTLAQLLARASWTRTWQISRPRAS